MDQLNKPVDDILDKLVIEITTWQTFWINAAGRESQIKFLIKDSAVYTEEELIQTIEDFLQYDKK